MDHDNIELDSLESCGMIDRSTNNNNNNKNIITITYEDDDDDDRSRAHEPLLTRLNLDGMCKGVGDGRSSNGFVDDAIVLLPALNALTALSLRSNDLQMFPASVLKLITLQALDLSDNNLLTVPPEINKLTNLIELALDKNVLSVLPSTLWDLRCLQVLKLGNNRLTLPPDKFSNMRALILADTDEKPDNVAKTNILTTLNLRANRLKGSIVLGNYGNLTELDVSDNNIESLDLVAVERLEVLQCSRNSLTRLMLYGKNLTSLIAGNNKLQHLSTTFPPIALKHLDVSYNNLESLPEWLCGCNDLRSLFASNNALAALPEHLFCNEMPYLHTVQLAYNQLESLPPLQRRLPIRELFLQNNTLSLLPDNLFKSLYNINVLNVSNNRLCDLPQPETVLQLEKLYVTANCLNDKAVEKVSPYLRNLKIFHAAYNNMTRVPDNCAVYWTEIEEIVFSGNKLTQLPPAVGALKHLTTLRVHSNLVHTVPPLCNLLALRVLDLAHNQLDRIDFTALVPPNLKCLDLSCNTRLHVDSQQFHAYRTQRPMSLVDVSGKNRTSLPLAPGLGDDADRLADPHWSCGFSETSGSKSKLYVAQIRLPAFCNTEALFGMFDGEANNDVPLTGIDKIVPRILLEERTVKETASDYMKYTLLSAHRELKDKGQRHAANNAIVVHVVKSKVPAEFSFCGAVKKYVMRVASVGDLRVALGRTGGGGGGGGGGASVKMLPVKQRKSIRTNPQIQVHVPDPDVSEVYLDEHDEYLIVANKHLWDVIAPETALKEVGLQRNVILAAKRLQDLAQSYGAEENLSVIVVKFNFVGSDVDLLMRELRQTIRRNYPCESATTTIAACRPGCCCETLSNECANCEKLIEDRSSPSGQSEHAACSDCNSSARSFVNQLNRQHDAVRAARAVAAPPPLPPPLPSSSSSSAAERKSYRGVAKALRARRETDAKDEETDSALSEEQFKCWEYMLEQNTQLLFDKELNTLSRGIRRPFAVKNPPLSRSSPHLNDAHNNNNGNNGSGSNNSSSFLTRQFGSARSFNPVPSRQQQSSRLSFDKKLIGGPHAAYFGSLQRLMPYNLEYDFAVMQERGLADSMDLDRMQQYWGVTTTEL